MHLADRIALADPWRARPYAGPADHPAMTRVLAAHRVHAGVTEMPTVEQMDLTYGNLEDCDPATDVAIVERDGEVVAYTRTSWEDLESGTRDFIVFAPTLPEHLDQPFFDALIGADEAHLAAKATDGEGRLRAYAFHPGPDQPATGESAWFEARGYVATEWSASLVRPHLDDIPERDLPEGVEIRPVQQDQLRTIVAAHFEAFRGEWDFHEPTEADFVEIIDHPDRDETLWKVAWAGDEVVGQVKSYIVHDENAARGYRRGYTEDISTHRDWRNRGIAGALLVASLREVRDRGMTEAALGVDTNNPGGAFHVYTSLGFELHAYEAIYTKSLG